MTVKHYLEQANRLEDLIESNIAEMERLRTLAAKITAGWDENHNPNTPTEAAFVKPLEKLVEMEFTISQETTTYIALRKQIRQSINKIENKDERIVLRYRYLHKLTWEEIGTRLYADEKTTRRWHDDALLNFKMPEKPIII